MTAVNSVTTPAKRAMAMTEHMEPSELFVDVQIADDITDHPTLPSEEALTR